MTLTVNSSSIIIKNSAGQTKFTSNDKLVYLKNQQIGTFSFYGNNLGLIEIPFYSMESNDFLYLSLKFNSCTGNAISQELLGRWIPANGSIVTNFRGFAAGAGGQPGVETCIFGGVASQNSLLFCEYRSGAGQYTSDDRIKPTGISGNVTYDARTYSYL